MNFRTLLTFVVGAVLVTGIAGFGLIHAYERAHALEATSAVIESDTAVVGTAFSGVIEEVAVRTGEHVEAGDELFRLQSPTLQQARETVSFNEEGVGYTVAEDDTMIFVATADGTVGALPYGVGSFVPANSEITTITLDDSLRVRASVPMTADRYARLSMDTPVQVTLPAGSTVAAEVYELAFEETDAGTTAVIRSRVDADVETTGLASGAPVTATLQLEDDGGMGSWAAERLSDLLTPREYRA
ncbi:HlyD family efflux transporter periplasmic adaptor subunit [Nostocoides sp. F2B08]|uniref:HlyD family efflux transporter periplasmic adaptor subunit n=1 Tax=Nostocoides sp. F2B08 TaxID=2653936 RepID=UPI001262BB4D|nr:HlyD family efflux transporter periplasmic adaptor subunit [Tetrasphaera sp. F2B08]KAB7744062.1 HlyD family efflux transporter periplasmic adaptor subunit [Tetrasphaera sp. F2B08]